MATREREFGNLRAIKDNYPKYVISMTPLLTRNDDLSNNRLRSLHFLKIFVDFQTITVKGHDEASLHIRGFLERRL